VTEDVGATAYLSRFADGEMHLVDIVDAIRNPRVELWVGLQSSAHATALGKQILADLPDEERLDYLSRHRLEELTPRTISDRTTLLTQLEHSPGWAVDHEEYVIGATCVAVPVLAIGSWIWLRRHASPFAAFVGAAFLTVAGPVASTADFPNYSWAVCMIPWALRATEWVCERPSARSVSTLAVLVALQAVAGEAVTLAATCGLIVAATMFLAPPAARAPFMRRVMAVGIAIAAGAALSAIQTLPLFEAARLSTRGGEFDNLFWSAHPLAFAETVAPHLFGHGYGSLSVQPWLEGVNDGREPLLYSLYIGVCAYALAMLARADGADRRWRRFWGLVLGVGIVCALGEYTPVYPAVQRLVPVLRAFRFPLKYLVLSTFALAALLVSGVDALLGHVRGERPMTRPVAAVLTTTAIAVAAVGLLVVSVAFRQLALALWEAVAKFIALSDPVSAARAMMPGAPFDWGRLLALAIGTTVLIALVWRKHRFARAAAYGLCVSVLLDPLVINADLNPTIAAAVLGPPSWLAATTSHRDDRVYVGGYVPKRPAIRNEKVETVDDPGDPRPPLDISAIDALSRIGAEYALTPSAWHIHQIISYDLPQLWPREYMMVLKAFRDAPSRDARLRFLERVGVRYCLLPEAPTPGATPLASLGYLGVQLTLYECGANPQRVYVAPSARIEPSIGTALALMFDADHDPRAEVLLGHAPPPASGEAGAPVVPSAHIVEEHANSLAVSAHVGAGGGYLTVLDSYDPDWHAEVDGLAAPLLRADGVFRAVRLAPGAHMVRFTYHPRAFYMGAAVSGIAGCGLLLALLAVPVAERRMRARRGGTRAPAVPLS
jgi:hypothetical protein